MQEPPARFLEAYSKRFAVEFYNLGTSSQPVAISLFLNANYIPMDKFEALREKVLPLLKPYVKRISVFGSFARGEETPERDIDLMVELKPPDSALV